MDERMCDHNCDPEDIENFSPEAKHFLDCPVWEAALRNYKRSTDPRLRIQGNAT